MHEYTLENQLTELLMGAGAAVNKQSIEALIGFIHNRDHAIYNKIKKDLERNLHELDRDTGRFDAA